MVISAVWYFDSSVIFLRREKLNRKMLGAAAGFGLAVWALPALLLALSARYQAPGALFLYHLLPVPDPVNDIL